MIKKISIVLLICNEIHLVIFNCFSRRTVKCGVADGRLINNNSKSLIFVKLYMAFTTKIRLLHVTLNGEQPVALHLVIIGVDLPLNFRGSHEHIGK